MCGIVGAAAERYVFEILLEGLERLELRGWNIARVVLLDDEFDLGRVRQHGKVLKLAALVEEEAFCLVK